MTFEAPDEETFPATKLARAAFRTGGTAPVIFNGANEAAVALFLAGRIGFLKITELIEGALEACAAEPLTCVESVFAADRQAREAVERLALRR